LRLALERPLPQELALAEVVPDPAREDEEEIRETVQIGERLVADLLDAHQAEDVALRAATDGACDVEVRAHAAAAGQHERAERLQVLLAGVHHGLERGHLLAADAEHSRLKIRLGRRELAPEVEELVLQALQDLVEAAAGGRAAKLRVHGACDAERGVQLVDRAVCVDARAVLRDARAADEVGVAAVTPARVDACQADRHRQTRWKSAATPSGAGGMRATARSSATCSRRLMPTSAVVIPGVERTNWSARCADVSRPGRASVSTCGSRR